VVPPDIPLPLRCPEFWEASGLFCADAIPTEIARAAAAIRAVCILIDVSLYALWAFDSVRWYARHTSLPRSRDRGVVSASVINEVYVTIVLREQDTRQDAQDPALIRARAARDLCDANRCIADGAE
jgi:hypothetical protein